MTKRLTLLGLIATLAIGGSAGATDQPIPGTISVVKPLKLAKFVGKSSLGFTLPAPGGAEDPTLHGAELRLFDVIGVGGAGSFSHGLPAAGWRALGNPPGSKGYKYKGAPAGDATCRVVLIKPTVIKAVCKGAGVTLDPPFAGNPTAGDEGVILGVPSGTVGAAIRYCAEFGGTESRNDSTLFKHKGAAAPGSCPVAIGPAPTATETPTGAASTTLTPTFTPTGTPIGVPTGTATATATPTCGGAVDISCDGDGYIGGLADECIADGGINAAGDSLEVYCCSGQMRFCLSDEACPWRSGCVSGTATCSRAGLTSDFMAIVVDMSCSPFDGLGSGTYNCDPSGQIYFPCP